MIFYLRYGRVRAVLCSGGVSENCLVAILRQCSICCGTSAKSRQHRRAHLYSDWKYSRQRSAYRLRVEGCLDQRDLFDTLHPTLSAPKYQLDHIIPLCLGGSPTDPSNLQLEPWAEAYRKDRVEIQAMRCVCASKATLAEAQHDLARDWQAAYHKYAKMVCRRPRR